MATTAERIKEGMKLRNLKQIDIIEKTGINKGALSSYIAGTYEPKQRNIYKIAKVLDVNEAWLMGYDVPMERMSEEMQEYKEKMKAFAKEWNLKFNEKKLVTDYRKLNEEGQKEALKQVENLTYINKYIENNIVELKPKEEIEIDYMTNMAANSNDDISYEDKMDAVQQTLREHNKRNS